MASARKTEAQLAAMSRSERAKYEQLAFLEPSATARRKSSNKEEKTDTKRTSAVSQRKQHHKGKGKSGNTSSADVAAAKAVVPIDSRPYTLTKENRQIALRTLIEEDSTLVNAAHNETGNTALFAAVEGNLEELVQWLIEHGADVSQKNRRGETPLHVSIGLRRDKITLVLLEHGARLRVEDNLGKSAFIVADKAPLYQTEVLKPFLREEDSRLVHVDEAAVPADATENAGVKKHQHRREVITVFVKGGKPHEFHVSEKHTGADILRKFAAKWKLEDIASDIELSQVVMGKEAEVAKNSIILQAYNAWPNKNPAYCKFVIRLRPGTHAHEQERYRSSLSGSKS